MYQCTECGRKYARQNSLTRHLQNHRKNKRHVCPVCNVVFYRGDLLSRHAKLHQGSAIAYHENLLPGQTTRRRCHTACGRCRDHRTKCNGELPCSTCVKANKETQCHFNRKSNRLSHIPTTGEESSIPDEPDDDTDSKSADTQSEDEEQNEGQDQSHLSTLPPTLEGVREYGGDIEQHHPSHQIQRTDLPSHMAFLAAIGQDALPPHSMSIPDPTSDEVPLHFEPHMFNAVSWPWLHESLYMPDTQNSLLDSVDAAGTMDFTRTVMSDPPMSNPNETYDHHFHDVSGAINGLSSISHTNTQSMSLRSVVQELPATHANIYTVRASTDHPKQMDESYTRQIRVIDELIAYSLMPNNSGEQSPDRSMFWNSISPKVARAFNENSDQGLPSSSTLQHFIDLYFKHFGPLWPLLSFQNLKVNHLHPVLYLVLTSIGAMYGGTAACNYGAMIHNSIRTQLTSAFELDDLEGDFIWLAQARLLTQVAALYFGQPKAFSYAQHLGALLVAQARRMDLFSAAHAKNAMATFRQLSGSSPNSNRLGVWLHLETRRRLAFGIFRGDTYTSVMLHVKPLVCMEEIDLELPSCDAVWRAEKMPTQVCLYLIEHDRTPSRDMRASDIYRIALDPDEMLPPLDPAGHELLLFGLQWPLWRFSRDQKVFERLTGQERDCLAQPQDVSESPDSATRSMATGSSGSGSRPSKIRSASTTKFEVDRLDGSSRRMSNLALECSRFMAALRKWEMALPLVKNFVHTDGDRSSLLSSLVLYHLGYLRLYAPVEDLHQIQYRLADNRPLDDALLRSVYQWANSYRARLAAERACSIWSLITTESRKTQNHRVRFNLVAFTGLHHGAVLLWSYAGARDLTSDMQSGAPPLSLDVSEDPFSTKLVTRAESSNILNSFVRLYDLISPARWSSLAKAANNLANQDFPTLNE